MVRGENDPCGFVGGTAGRVLHGAIVLVAVTVYTAYFLNGLNSALYSHTKGAIGKEIEGNPHLRRDYEQMLKEIQGEGGSQQGRLLAGEPPFCAYDPAKDAEVEGQNDGQDVCDRLEERQPISPTFPID